MQPVGIYCFGPFELHPARYELLRGSRRVRISVSLIDLLLLFVSRPGELVTRDQIVRVLWKEPQSVDVRQGINTAIARLRAALEDDPVHPRFLETVIGKGYRFIGEVGVVPALEDPAPAAIAVSQAAFQDVPPGQSSSTSGGAVVLESPILALTAANSSRTTLPTGNTLLLVSLLLAIVSAAALAFKHRRPPEAPARGLWNERQITTNDIEVPVEAAALSSDAGTMAYMAANSLFVREMATGRTREWKAPALRASQLAWFPNQTGLLITGYPADSIQPEIWIAAAKGDPVLFHRAADGGIPSPDGQTVAFLTVDGREIHLEDAHGVGERVFAKAVADEPFSALFWSADGKRVGYQQRHPLQTGGVDIQSNYQWTYVSREIKTGRETSSVRDLFFDSAAETADGRLFFLRSANGHDPADRGMWTVQIDSKTGVPVGTPTRICCAVDSDRLSGLAVAAGGTQVMAVKQFWYPNVSIAELKPSGPTLGKIKRLTFDSRSDFPHAWSVDDRTVYFESDRVNGLYHLFRQDIDRPSGEMLTIGDKEQFFPTMVPDGKTLLYEQWEQSPDGKKKTVYRASTDGRDPKLVLSIDSLDEWRCPLLSGSCVLRETEDRDFVFYKLDLASGKGEELARCTREPTLLGDWALSPDGQTAALPNHAEQSPSIRLVHLYGSEPETAVHVRQIAQLRGIQWAVDGRGFYAAVYVGKVHWLEYIALHGEVRPLRITEDDSWMVPSPDGKKVALVDSSISRNVFLWK